jgi:CRISPR-associated protein Cmr6
MRAPHPKGTNEAKNEDPNTKLDLLEKAQGNAHYDHRLAVLENRLERLAGSEAGGLVFAAKASWRVRVGGHRGPESTLLPAFDAMGIPYIPSSTLRGIARTQAIREEMAATGCNWKTADRAVAPYFGHLDAEKHDCAGKVIFFDAYPRPGQHGLAIDMANNIWHWEGDTLEYKPNPNTFLSLDKPTFNIGIKLAMGQSDRALLNQVKSWLAKGLQAGTGSQVNSGYGELLVAGSGRSVRPFLEVPFTLEGQLIHGHQKSNWNARRQKWENRGVPEVRPIAFKSMLRYWFRALALGVLEPREVEGLEAKLFGGINPSREWGWVWVTLHNGRVRQKEPRSNQQPCGAQEGLLCLALAAGCLESHQDTVSKLLTELTWLMFHLGGIGQGARRPCYSRQNRETAPWYRGSSLFPPENEPLWDLPDHVKAFKTLFQKHLNGFYANLDKLATSSCNPRQPKAVGQVTRTQWAEAIDHNCRIVVCSGREDFEKPFALARLHAKEFKRGNEYDGNLCGQVQGGVKPSPVWVVSLGNYDVATVFGASAEPRSRYLNALKSNSDEYQQIWPFQ